MYDGKIPKTKKVKLNKSELCVGSHIKLRDYARAAIRKRNVFASRLFGNNDTRRVSRGVSWHSLNSHTHIKQLTNILVLIIKLFKLFALEGRCNSHVHLSRNELRNHINSAIRHSESSSYITNRRSCSESAKGNDLCNLVVAISTFDILYNFFASGVTEVDIKVRHRNALGVKKTLKKKVKRYRIDIGNTDAESNQATRAGASARTYGNILRFCVSHKIRDDEEVGVKAHFVNHGKLILNSRDILFLSMSCEIKSTIGKLLLKANISILTKFIDVGKILLGLEIRQMKLIKLKIKIALLCYFNCIFNGTLESCKEGSHLIGALEVKLFGFKSEGHTIGHNVAGLYTKKRRLKLCIALFKVMHVVGSNHRYTKLSADKAKAVRDLSLVLNAMILNFKVKIVAEDFVHLICGTLRLFHTTSEDKLWDFSCKTSR